MRICDSILPIGMKKIIEGYKHKTGSHCGSTTTSNLLRFHNINLSEEMCFGLGSGIAFCYFAHPDFDPPIFVSGRTQYLEIDLCVNLGLHCTLRSGNFDNEWRIIKEKIDNNEPTIALVDTYFLPYFKTRYHFPMHRVIIVGYNDEEDIVYISDNEREEIQEVPYKIFKKARTSSSLPIPTENKWFEIAIENKIKPIKTAIRDAIEKTYYSMFQQDCENYGVKGLKKFTKDLKMWDKTFGDKWKEAVKFTYLFFEKFGTGGGNFRFLYAGFLNEIKEIYQTPKLNKVADDYQKVASKWQDFANLIKSASKEENFEKIIFASDKFSKFISEEQEIYKNLYSIVGG